MNFENNIIVIELTLFLRTVILKRSKSEVLALASLAANFLPQALLANLVLTSEAVTALVNKVCLALRGTLTT